MVLDLFAVPRPECKEGRFCSRVVTKGAFVVVEDAFRGHSLQIGWIFSKKARTAAGLTFALLRLMFVGFRTLI
jgi:hypothetical protein